MSGLNLDDFKAALTFDTPEIYRAYDNFNWQPLLDAKNIRCSSGKPIKHIKNGLVPPTISIDEYKQIWSVFSKLKLDLQNKRSKSKYYQSNKDKLTYKAIKDKGYIKPSATKKSNDIQKQKNLQRRMLQDDLKRTLRERAKIKN